MFLKILLSLFSILIFTACSKKVSVSTYSDIDIPLKQLKKVNITIEGDDYFLPLMQDMFPLQFDGHTILQHNHNSPSILHIIQNPITQDSKFYDTQEEKTIRYVSYVFNEAQNKTVPVVKYREVIYFKRCLVTDYTASASVTTRYKRETVFATITDEYCIKRRFDIFNNNEFRPLSKRNLQQQLAQKLSFNIKNYLIPYQTSYTIEINEDIDVEFLEIEKQNYENILEMLDDGIYSDELLQQLLKLHNKYPHSYAINYNIGLVYEYLTQNSNALIYYQKCLDIKTTKDIIKRISTVKNNIQNKQLIQID